MECQVCVRHTLSSKPGDRATEDMGGWLQVIAAKLSDSMEGGQSTSAGDCIWETHVLTVYLSKVDDRDGTISESN